eukprot:CAMPEP_0173384566 /NCGR_PEP_ID=MMETSP1356-20130122/7141_1 /TAXON_ID=77927 ORGANISM="Hemiselmis virescens, Strain PCC157" /NCGR_SAMPLE_ID=MMETSP1356 /ASSEMBLY_ACC=CAM_ASM_000847 /LENGTH=141 /DNA_ID=CAMNT_0014339983 /DNA_START=34 /DNA_END=455 /DNA_ORIENTATION=-
MTRHVPANLAKVAFLLCIAISLPAPAASVTHEGFIVDKYCWDKPGHVGIDGSNLETAPEAHTVHCMVDIASCRDGGFVLLEKKSGASVYSVKYVLDAAGNTKALEFLDALKASDGGGRKSVIVSAEGTVGSDGSTFSLTTL